MKLYSENLLLAVSAQHWFYSEFKQKLKVLRETEEAESNQLHYPVRGSKFETVYGMDEKGDKRKQQQISKERRHQQLMFCLR